MQHSYTYHDRIELPDELTIGTLRMVDEYLIEHGSIDGKDTNSRTFSIEIEGDLWDMREKLSEVEQQLQSLGIDFVPDRTKVE